VKIIVAIHKYHKQTTKSNAFSNATLGQHAFKQYHKPKLIIDHTIQDVTQELLYKARRANLKLQSYYNVASSLVRRSPQNNRWTARSTCLESRSATARISPHQLAAKVQS
jgi:hypothetical protein